jgi:hypothetical protein
MIMKRYLLSFLLIACAFLNKSNAQCTILNITTANIRKTTVNGNCAVMFDLTISAQLNNGNKGIWVHFWDEAQYPSTPWNYSSGSAPSAAFLVNTLGTLGVDNSGTTPIVLTSYPFDPSPPVKMVQAQNPLVNTSGSGSSTIYSYLFTNVVLTLPSNSCNIPTVKADVWSTQANSLGPNTKTQCSFPGRSLNIGDVSLLINTPTKKCATKSSPTTSLNFQITTASVTPIQVTYEIHKDDNVYIGITPVYDQIADQNVTVGGSKTVTLSASSPYTAVNFTDFIGYNDPSQYATNYWVVVSYTPLNGTQYSITNITKSSCAQILPVSFKSFTASRANAANTLKWTTATEINNKGFYIQRFYNSQWTNVMFVASKAENGNSSTDLNYSVNDVFNFKGVVQYRILQVDIDGRSKYSDVRSLSSVNQAGNALVYPNPAASNGNVSIILADATSSYDIHIIDNAGRIVKQFTAVKGNQQVSGLPRGQYMARVMDKVSGESTVDKFIVQ